MMPKNSFIYVAGHHGLVGSALMHTLIENGYTNILTRSIRELDLRKQKDVEDFFKDNQPDYVFCAAARVGGIKANNDHPAQFIYDNLMIQSNIIHSAHKVGVRKLLFLGSSCIYPKLCPQPIKEEYLMTGLLEPTNEPYAIAKIAGLSLCKSYYTEYNDLFISCMPTNLYGPGDNFNLETSHVMPALIAKCYQAYKQGDASMTLWGSGMPRREFLYVDDLADALLYLMNHYEKPEHINIGTGIDISIKELAELIAECIGYQGEFIFDTTKPDGTPQKLLDVQKINDLGWRAKTSLKEGIQKTIEWYAYHILKETPRLTQRIQQ